jgi:uncharacterized protein with von Willebrand factor type A (vWA) domain
MSRSRRDIKGHSLTRTRINGLDLRSDSMTDNATVLARMVEAYNNDDLDGVVAEAADDVEYVLGSRGLRLVGRAAWRSVVGSVASAIPGRRLHVSNRWSAGMSPLSNGRSKERAPDRSPAIRLQARR